MCLMVKKYSWIVNNQILEQIYMDMLEKLKMEACSVQIWLNKFSFLKEGLPSLKQHVHLVCREHLKIWLFFTLH